MTGHALNIGEVVEVTTYDYLNFVRLGESPYLMAKFSLRDGRKVEASLPHGTSDLPVSIGKYKPFRAVVGNPMFLERRLMGKRGPIPMLMVIGEGPAPVIVPKKPAILLPWRTALELLARRAAVVAAAALTVAGVGYAVGYKSGSADCLSASPLSARLDADQSAGATRPPNLAIPSAISIPTVSPPQ